MMFGRKRKKKAPPPAARAAAEYDALGFEYDDPGRPGAAFGVRASTRIHMAIFGQPGSGKSSVMKLLILQNLQRGEGFMVVDPHGELARTILSMIPEARRGDVVYLNPSSIYRYGRTILINPLEVDGEEEKYIVVMSFVNALFNLYKDSWGPRLETVLRNAANALVECEGHNTLGDITRMISSKSDRKELLRMVSSQSVLNFWTEIFEKQYSKDAGSAAYNKMDKIMSTPAVAAMLDTTKSSIRLSDAIRNRMMFIVDLSSGASDDVAAFIGTILLNMLYVEAKKRMDLEGDAEKIKRNPFYVYVDEAHLFSNSTMSEMLRALRKFGVRMTIATQTINAYEKSFADEICGVCQCIVCGKCDYNTARAVQTSMPISADELQDLQDHTFAFCSSEGGVPVHGVCKSQPVPAAGQAVCDWRDVARRSLEKWGEAVSIAKYARQSVVRDVPLSPLAAAILHMLFYSNRDMTRVEITEHSRRVFGERLKSEDIAGALVNQLERDLQFVTAKFVKSDDGDGKLATRYVASLKAKESYFSRAAYGRRAGSDLHLETMFQIADIQARRGNYVVCDLGNQGESLPDVLILEPETYEEDGRPRKSAERWDERTALAVEVETDPTKHIGQVYKNWKKNVDTGLKVWFVAFSERHAAAIRAGLGEKDVDPSEYHVTIISRDMVLSGEVGRVDVPVLSESFGATLPECGPGGATLEPRVDAEYDARTGRSDGAVPERVPSAENVPPAEHAPPTERAPPGEDVPPVKRDGAEPKSHATPPGTDEMPSMTPIEWDIYNAINEGMSVSPAKIRAKMSLKCTEKEIYDAVSSLAKKGLVLSEYQTASKRLESLVGGSPKKINRRERIVRKAELAPNEEHAVGKPRMVPTKTPDDTTKSKQAEYSPKEFENMGKGRLLGLLHSDRTSGKQKRRIEEIMKARGYMRPG